MLLFVYFRYYILGAMFGNANTGKYFTTAQFVIFFSYQIAMHFLAVLAIVIVSSAASREVNIKEIDSSSFNQYFYY